MGVLAGVFEPVLVAGAFESVFASVCVGGVLCIGFCGEGLVCRFRPTAGFGWVHALPGSAWLVVTDIAKANVRKTAVVLRICIVLPCGRYFLTVEGIG